MINVKAVKEFWLLFLFIVHLKIQKITHAQNVKYVGPITHNNNRSFGLILPTDFKYISTNFTIYFQTAQIYKFCSSLQTDSISHTIGGTQFEFWRGSNFLSLKGICRDPKFPSTFFFSPRLECTPG